MDNRFTLADRRKVRLRVDELTEREQSTRQIIGLLIQGAREIRERLKVDEEYYPESCKTDVVNKASTAWMS